MVPPFLAAIIPSSTYARSASGSQRAKKPGRDVHVEYIESLREENIRRVHVRVAPQKPERGAKPALECIPPLQSHLQFRSTSGSKGWCGENYWFNDGDPAPVPGERISAARTRLPPKECPTARSWVLAKERGEVEVGECPIQREDRGTDFPVLERRRQRIEMKVGHLSDYPFLGKEPTSKISGLYEVFNCAESP